MRQHAVAHGRGNGVPGRRTAGTVDSFEKRRYQPTEEDGPRNTTAVPLLLLFDL